MYLFSSLIPSPLSSCSQCNILRLLFAVSRSRRMSHGSLCSLPWKWLGVSKQGGFLYGLYLNKHQTKLNRWKIAIVSQREAINTSYYSCNGWNAPQWGCRGNVRLRWSTNLHFRPEPWTVAEKSLKWKLRIHSRQSWHCCLTVEVVELEKMPLITPLHHHLWQIA